MLNIIQEYSHFKCRFVEDIYGPCGTTKEGLPRSPGNGWAWAAGRLHTYVGLRVSSLACLKGSNVLGGGCLNWSLKDLK
jgi:hypothetical protein